MLPDGRVGVAVGRVDDPERRDRLRSDLRAGRWERLDDEEVPPGAEPALQTIVCGLIDRPASRISYRAVGDQTGSPTPLVAAPDGRLKTASPLPGRPVTVDLPPGSTVLFCTSPIDSAAALLDQFPTAHPDELADRLMGDLAHCPGPGIVAVLYRHPPPPLSLTLPALPANLADVRDRLRSWLALAGVGFEPAADVLLAVGEAASNAAEHAGADAARNVTLSVEARICGEGLRLTVSDNGRWRTPPTDPGHRGHGLRLINALVDVADLTIAEHGTTVEMLKELRR